MGPTLRPCPPDHGDCIVKNFLPVLGVLLLSGCLTQNSYNEYLNYKKLPAAQTDSIPHCRGYGCKFVERFAMSEQDWKPFDKMFPAKSARDEREKIAYAVGMFEEISGQRTGTAVDRAGTFLKLGDYQMDCVDESSNTSFYITAMARRGLVRFHKIEAPDIRLPISGGGGWVHQTAVMTEIATGDKFAVDSWFKDNGHPAYVVPLRAWKTGWRPPE